MPNICCDTNSLPGQVHHTLTLPGPGFFENLTAGRPSRPAGNISRMGCAT